MIAGLDLGAPMALVAQGMYRQGIICPRPENEGEALRMFWHRECCLLIDRVRARDQSAQTGFATRLPVEVEGGCKCD